MQKTLRERLYLTPEFATNIPPNWLWKMKKNTHPTKAGNQELQKLPFYKSPDVMEESHH